MLNMGCRSFAHICQRITYCITFIYGICNIPIINYLDDIAGAGTPDRVWHSYNKLGQVLCHSGLEDFAEKACDPSMEMIFVGVLFNSDNLTLTVSPERLLEMQELVSDWLKKDEATIKELQSVFGKLNFVAHYVKPACILVCRLLNWLCSI